MDEMSHKNYQAILNSCDDNFYVEYRPESSTGQVVAYKKLQMNT